MKYGWMLFFDNLGWNQDENPSSKPPQMLIV
jgi:hypothetical protein